MSTPELTPPPGAEGFMSLTRGDAPSPGNGEDAEPARAPAYSDEALALRFAERHAGDFRYVAEWSKWLSWARTHWRADNTLHAFDRARQIVREAAKACKASKRASLIASAKTVAAVERLAKSDRRLAATIDQSDGNPDIFNTPTEGS